MPHKEGNPVATLFDKVSDYPRTSALTSLSVGLITSDLLYLNERRKQEARMREQRSAQVRERIQRFRDYNEITRLPFYVHTNSSNEEIPDRQLPPNLMRNLDPFNVIYPRPK